MQEAGENKHEDFNNEKELEKYFQKNDGKEIGR
jgi:hypothetical protein